MRTLPFFVAIVLGVGFGLLACNALLGIKELPNDEDAESAGEGGGGDGALDGSVVVDGDVVVEPPPGPPQWRLAHDAGPAVHSMGIAFDENRQRMALFGGYASEPLTDGGARSVISDATWEWDGATWSKRTLPTSPSGRYGHRLVADVARKEVFLFGGTRGSTVDQYGWDGTRWRAKTSATLPPSFQTLGLAYDSDRNVTVMFGGLHYEPNNTTVMWNETWEWNGTDWAKRTPMMFPIARRGHAMAYDAARKQVVVFGGRLESGIGGDTWLFDGNNWSQAEPIDFPPARFGACMAFDPRRKNIVMFGGQAGTQNNFAETWHWDGKNWSVGPTGPPPLRSCAMAWDPIRRAIVLFGGAPNGDQKPPSAQTWLYE